MVPDLQAELRATLATCCISDESSAIVLMSEAEEAWGDECMRGHFLLRDFAFMIFKPVFFPLYIWNVWDELKNACLIICI